MKVVLLFPPCWHPIMPHMALPSLTAYLRGQGVEVIQRDLNIEIYDALLSRRNLGQVMRQLERQNRRGSAGARQSREQAELSAWALANGHAIAAQVDRAKDTIRSSRFYEAVAGMGAFMTIMDGLQLASAPHFPSSLLFTGYESAYPPDTSRSILAAVRDQEKNVFYDILRNTIVPQIARERPDLIGISLTSARQVIAGFTLAHLVKEAGIDTHITLGGKMITCWRDLLPAAPHLFDFFDSAVTFAGEEALLKLVEALDEKKDLSSVPNLMYRQGDRVERTEVAPPLSIDDLPRPDYEGFPMDRYLAPERVLPISASRGCYWHRCAFCNVGHGESRRYVEKKAAKVLGEMQALSERWNSPYFFFSDEAVSPRIFKALSKLLLEEGAQFKWTAAARFERSLDAETLQRMADAGCQMLMYGLESGSAKTLERMSKGTDLDVVRRILKDGARSGIWNHLFFFFGFPGETLQDAQETVDFVYSQGEYVHSACSGTFLLERHSLVEQNPENYDVTRLIQSRNNDLGYYYDFESACGLDPQQAERVEDVFISSLPGKGRGHIYSHDIYRFLYASQLDRETPLPLLLESERPAT